MYNSFLRPVILTKNIHLLRLHPNHFRRVHSNVFDSVLDLWDRRKNSFCEWFSLLFSLHKFKKIFIFRSNSIRPARCRWQFYARLRRSTFAISFKLFLSTEIFSNLKSNYVLHFTEGKFFHFSELLSLGLFTSNNCLSAKDRLLNANYALVILRQNERVMLEEELSFKGNFFDLRFKTREAEEAWVRFLLTNYILAWWSLHSCKSFKVRALKFDGFVFHKL